MAERAVDDKSFNSILVWLKARYMLLLTLGCISFNSILVWLKVPVLSAGAATDESFNSILVWLKDGNIWSIVEAIL